MEGKKQVSRQLRHNRNEVQQAARQEKSTMESTAVHRILVKRKVHVALRKLAIGLLNRRGFAMKIASAL